MITAGEGLESLAEGLRIAADAALLVLDRDERVVSINDAFSQLFSINGDECVGEDFRRFVLTRLSCKFENAVEVERALLSPERASTPGVERRRFRLLTPPGEPNRWLENHGAPVTAGPFEGGWVEQFRVLGEDPQPISHDEVELQSLAKGIDEVNCGIVCLDSDEKVTFANGRIHELVGVRVSQLIGRNALDFVAPDSLARVRREINRRKGGARSTYSVALRRKDGTCFPCLLSASPRLDASGGFAGSVVIVNDLSEVGEDQIASENTRDIINDLDAPVLVADHDGKVSFINQAASQTFGWSQKAVLGLDLWALLEPDRDETALADHRAALIRNRRWSGIRWLCDSAGRMRAYRMRDKARLRSDGSLLGFLSTVLGYGNMSTAGRQRGAESGGQRGSASVPRDEVQGRAGAPATVATLTKRQKDVLGCLVQGQSNRQIAQHLGLSEATVKLHVHRILAALGVENRTQAAMLADYLGLTRNGGVEPGSKPRD